jgi:NADPH:quinone reductase-like Zn-dependent oxidoreductase
MRRTALCACMRACVYERYGGPEVVRVAEVPSPVPKADEVRVCVVASTVTSADHRIRALDAPRGFGLMMRPAFGIRRPRQRILGTELSGVVDAVGDRVTRFRPGDAVFAFPGAKLGCHAEYRTLPQDGPVAPKPARLSFDEAAALSFGGSAALHFLDAAALAPGERLLVVGASGAVGAALVQLAKHRGAHVTGVTSARNLDFVRSLGADEVVDHTTEDFAARGESYHVVADAVGVAPFARSRRVLRKGGTFLGIVATLPEMLAAPYQRVTSGRRIVLGPAREGPDVVRRLAELAHAGALRPPIDRRYDLSQIADAHAYVDTRRKRGSVVVAFGTP